MRLLIAVDMEGVTGVVSWDHVDSKTSEYQRFRRLMTDEHFVTLLRAEDLLTMPKDLWKRVADKPMEA